MITKMGINSLQIGVSGEVINDCVMQRAMPADYIVKELQLLDKSQDAIVIHDMENRIIYWSKNAVRLYGFSAEEAIGKNANELMHKESLKLIEARKNVDEKGEWSGELHQITKDGKEIVVESCWTLMCDSEGKPKSILIINTDITEKKNLKEQLLRAQRMESIGMLAGGIAHDLNNMLTPIMLSLQILQEKLNDEEKQRLLSIIETNTQRGADLIKQLMSFARGIEGELIPIQVSNLISEISKILKKTFPRSIPHSRGSPQYI